MRFVRLQREELVAALQFMIGEGWLQGEHPLHGMCEGLQQFVFGGKEHSLSVEAARSASLHWGSQMIKCRKGNEGARQDCYIFMAFNGPAGEPAEVCIMEIHHICKVEGTCTDAQGVQQDVKKKLALGVMATCEILTGPHRCNHYSDGPGLQPVGGAQDAVHMLPSVVRPLVGVEWYKYAVELKDVQATAFVGKLEGKKVYLPYVPMSSHA